MGLLASGPRGRGRDFGTLGLSNEILRKCNELFQKLLKHYGVANEVDNREKKIEPKTETHQDEVPLIETPIPAFGTKVISVISVVTPVLLALIVPRPANAVPTLTFPYSVSITFSGSDPS